MVIFQNLSKYDNVHIFFCDFLIFSYWRNYNCQMVDIKFSLRDMNVIVMIAYYKFGWNSYRQKT